MVRPRTRGRNHTDRVVRFLKDSREPNLALNPTDACRMRHAISLVAEGKSVRDALLEWFTRFMILRSGSRYRMTAPASTHPLFKLGAAGYTLDDAIKGTFSNVALKHNDYCVRRLRALNRLRTFRWLPLRHRVAVVYLVTILRDRAAPTL